MSCHRIGLHFFLVYFECLSLHAIFAELRLLHRLQLEALRVLFARRFELLVQQLLAGRADQQEQLQETQQLNLYDIAK